MTRRRGSDTPAPDHTTRAAFSAMSPAAGQATSGTPLASARTTVPCPAWHTTAAQCGSVRAYESQSTTRAFGGVGRPTTGSPRRFVVAITRTGSSASPSSAARSIRWSRSCDVLGATSTSGSSPGGSSTSSVGRSYISGPTTRIQGHDD
ncbi:MAG TPA: hypothetical protein VD790_03085 [Thermoleophilaceae bacterium]|nr:hypothetical protein [Thermoleophilaceae bacterium]